MKSSKKDKKLISNPLVSICTPTFNRRPFIPYLIKCILHQDYPIDKIEWIIVDDGTDKIEDIIEECKINNPKLKIIYKYFSERLLLGKKRNIMHGLCNGDFIIYMDDDDYYPVERISHAINVLQKNPSFLIAGSSEMHIYFKNLNKIYQFGPYKTNHATAASFAFRKELLLETKYDDNSAVAEEQKFLKDYTIPLIKLDVLKTILVFSHCHNSFDKNKLLEKPKESLITESKYNINDFIKHNNAKDKEDLRLFYVDNLDSILSLYEHGKPENKPQVLTQIKKMEDNRNERLYEYKKNIEIQQIKMYYQQLIEEKNKEIECKNHLISELFKKLKDSTK
jgi:glycosyltransferase involved in cell wall biosynthesis